ncbi:PH domain-containing protein [Roseomonas stagni]|uniref:PH domain-containing protein n=1 Tax=Falsiroseomonas algicola TaxID=2716930 RepID=A0A6M1LMU2_9PROT|nr:photosynthetic complex putative assembly protein PuhB [Falsiroseomonas algicola]NGM21533.1 PH domain-containing protein [Falsiroseomonas algicola]
MSNPAKLPIFEHDGEPVPGLPAMLPEGEVILWQGAPRWGGIARRALHLRGLALYFALIGVLRGTALAAEGASTTDAVLGGLLMLVVGAVPIALLAGFAVLAARTSLYTITNRRVVMRVGVALPMTISLPFALMQSAGVVKHADGTGDISMALTAPHRVAWIAVWPHTKSFRLARPEPTLRALADADQAAQILARALAAHAAMPVPAMESGSNRQTARPGAAALA